MKEKYIQNLETGTLVAFTLPSGEIKSGKVLKISETIQVEEFTGAKLEIPKSDIIWVKTGQRWPKEIFKALREGGTVEGK